MDYALKKMIQCQYGHTLRISFLDLLYSRFDIKSYMTHYFKTKMLSHTNILILYCFKSIKYKIR